MWRSSWLGSAPRSAVLGALAAALAAPREAPAQEHGHGRDSAATAAARGVAEIPRSMKEEHAELNARLVAATRAPGRVGEAAREVAKVLDPHFAREEQIALPPLGLLRPLAEGRAPAGMAAVLPMTDSLKRELPSMLTEHMAIGVAVKRLARVAKDAGHAEAERLAHEIQRHALTEEEVTYPAAVLVGELVRARARRSAPAGP